MASDRQRQRIELVIVAAMKTGLWLGSLCGLVAALASVTVRADQPISPTPRYGLFGWLDLRSYYRQGNFPEPFLVDDSGLEINEARLDWLRTEAGSSKSDRVKAEVEKGFGLLTVELEVPYVRNSTPDGLSKGFENLDLGLRYPVHQLVSDKGFFDNTVGLAIEVGIPTGSPVSKNAELVPKVFDDMKIGEYFTLQSVLGYSRLFGPGEEGGLQVFEYGFVFACTIQHQELPLPGIRQCIPMFELAGETELNKSSPGHNSLLGNAAVRMNLKTIGRVQPRIGLGYVFPVDSGAYADVHRGIFTSLVFEY